MTTRSGHRRLRAGIAALAVAASLAASPAFAETLTFAAYMAPKHPFYDRVMKPFVDGMKAASTGIRWRVIPGGQLLGARDSLDGVKGKVADTTFIVPTYYRTELPNINVLFQFIAYGDNVVAGTGATLEAMYLHCPQCLKDYADSNAVPLSSGSGGQYHIYCKEPANSVADLKGRKIRAVGALARLVDMMGGTPVNLPANEGVTAIQRGTLDCLIGPLTWITSYGYADAAPNVLNVPMGYVKGLGFLVMNQDTWSSLDVAKRKDILSRMGDMSARSTIDAYYNPDKELLDRADKLGLKIASGDGSFKALFKKFSDAEIAQVISAGEKSGATNPRDLVETIIKLYPKWEKIAEGTGYDIDKVAEAYDREVYSKLDPATFGVK